MFCDPEAGLDFGNQHTQDRIMQYEHETFSIDVLDPKTDDNIIDVCIGDTQVHLLVNQRKASLILNKQDAENVQAVSVKVHDDNKVIADSESKSFDCYNDFAVFCDLFESKLVLNAKDPVITIEITVRNEIEIPEEHACAICCADVRQVVPPCGHLGMCAACASNMYSCPWCRQSYDPDTQLTRIFHV
ncbi:MAG: hypothetical protein CMP20_04590 [Rickettsiales bacterium]|nr:hypothetical protein [Rickettsiales bacterium]